MTVHIGAKPGDIAETAGDAPSALFVYYSGHSDADALHLDGTRLPLQELVESVPKPLKEGIPKDEAEEIKTKIEEAGGQLEIK